MDRPGLTSRTQQLGPIQGRQDAPNKLITNNLYNNIVVMSQSMASEERCMKCGANEQLFVSLDCDHNFCLVCMSYVMIKSKTQNLDDSQVVCPLCHKTTHLDAQSVQAIQETIQNILVPNLTKYSPIEEVSSQNLEELDRVYAVSVKKSSDETKVQSGTGTGIMFEKESIKISKRYSEDPSYDFMPSSTAKYFFSKCGTPAHKSRESVGFRQCCPIHPHEDMTSICLTCSNELLCIKCLVVSRHKNHNVRSIPKGADYLSQQVNFKRLQINDKLEHLQIGQRRVKDKLDLLKERLARSQDNISESFQQLIKQIRRRQIQLQQDCLGQYKVLEEHLYKQLQSVHAQVTHLQGFKQRIQEVGLSQKPYDFIASYKQIMSLMGTTIEEYKSVNTMDFYFNEYLQISEDSLVSLFEEVNRLTFDVVSSCAGTKVPSGVDKRLAAFVSCHTSRDKKRKTMRTQEDFRGMKSKSPNFDISRGLQSRRDVSDYLANLLQQQQVSKSVYQTQRSVDNQSKNSTYSKASLSKLLSRSNLLEVQKKIRTFEKEKTEKKLSTVQIKDFNKSQKVISMRRKRV